MFFKRKKEESPEEKLDYMISRCHERNVILEAIAFACENYISVVEIIHESEDSKNAKENICKIYGFSEAQSQAIIDMRMKALTKSERKKLIDECQEYRSRYEALLKESRTAEMIKAKLDAEGNG